MEFIIELLVELILEGSIEISTNKKISKWIRYPLIGLIICFFGIVIVGIIALGISFIKSNVYVSIFFLLIGIFMLIGSFIKFKKIYLREKEK